MLNRLPTYIPPLSLLLDDIGAPSSHQVAKALNIPVDLVDTWRVADEAPRTVALSLFWLTRWGQSMVDADAVNTARLQCELASAARWQVAQLQRELARVLRLADFGCANAPCLAERPRVRVVN